MSKNKNGLLKFVAGLGLGVGVGMLFAPKKGVELRADIKQKLDDVKKRVDDTVAMCGEKCNCGESINVTVEEIGRAHV